MPEISFKPKFDAFGLVDTNPDMPDPSEHEKMEVAGKLLMYYGLTSMDDSMVEQILEPYFLFWDKIKFLPRTATKGVPPKEKKKGSWHTLRPYMDMEINIAVSHSQIMFLIIGASMSKRHEFAKTLAMKIIDADWKYKYGSIVTHNGSFTPGYGNKGIKIRALRRLMGTTRNLGWFDNWFSKWMLSTVGIWGDRISNSNKINTALLLGYMAYLGDEDHFQKWMPKQDDLMAELKLKWMTNGPHNKPDLMQDDLNYCVIELMRKRWL